MPNHEEPHVVEALAGLCRAVSAHCIVQVGAEDGYEAAMCMQKCDEGTRGIAIEADERCEPHNRFIEFYYFAIGATDSDTIFHLCGQGSGLSSTLHRDESVSNKTVKMRRLDTFCQELGAEPDVLIIDTEGTALDVLEGATGILDGVQIVYAECQTSTLRPGIRLVGEVDAFLVARGFSQHVGLPTYDAGGQGNYTWTKP